MAICDRGTRVAWKTSDEVVSEGSRARATPATYSSGSVGIDGSELELARSELYLSLSDLMLEDEEEDDNELSRSNATAWSSLACAPPVCSRRR
jgi:hypothetical protein